MKFLSLTVKPILMTSNLHCCWQKNLSNEQSIFKV